MIGPLGQRVGLDLRGRVAMLFWGGELKDDNVGGWWQQQLYNMALDGGHAGGLRLLTRAGRGWKSTLALAKSRGLLNPIST